MDRDAADLGELSHVRDKRVPIKVCTHLILRKLMNMNDMWAEAAAATWAV